MPYLSLLCLLVGAVIIVIRGPLIVVPEATRDFHRKLLGSRVRIRLMGLIFFLLSLGLILTGRDHGHEAAVIVTGFGYLLAFISVVLLIIFANIFELIAMAVLDALDSVMLRGVGVISVAVGLLFIYAGAFVFW